MDEQKRESWLDNVTGLQLLAFGAFLLGKLLSMGSVAGAVGMIFGGLSFWIPMGLALGALGMIILSVVLAIIGRAKNDSQTPTSVV